MEHKKSAAGSLPGGIRKYVWIFIPLVALGGLWYPKLGLLMLPIMLAMMVMGLLKGKYWCGNFCPHGSLYDYMIAPVSAGKKVPGFFKSRSLTVLMFGFFMFMLGSRLFKVFAIFGSAPFLDKLGYVFVLNYLGVTIVGSILALSVNPRTWCFFCPMGTFQVLMYKAGKLLGLNRATDVKVVACQESAACTQCGKCLQACPLELAPYEATCQGQPFSSEACIRCATCVRACPLATLEMGREANRKQAAA